MGLEQDIAKLKAEIEELREQRKVLQRENVAWRERAKRAEADLDRFRSTLFG